MAIRINNLLLRLEEDENILKLKAIKKVGLKEKNVKNFKIVKQSIDARNKSDIRFNYSVEFECDEEARLVTKINDSDVKFEENKYEASFTLGQKKPLHRPVIIGMGPAGLFAGLLMAEKGYNPIIFERGRSVEERTKLVDDFWSGGALDTDCNVQFGEGGAGTFSDGKLTTRSKDSRCDFITEELVKSGAPEEIKYMGKPHVGTDILKTVIVNIRKRIIELGGEVHFNSKLTDLIISQGKLQGIVVNSHEIPCESLILAIGHSSRDTYEMLYNKNLAMECKPFAIGVRIEHPQAMINESQYGPMATHPKLRGADYRLTYTSKTYDRSVYSFCMCPGGKVVAAASEEGNLVTNGMSYHSRDEKNANSALVVTVGPKDFMSSKPLAGMEFQRHYEKLAYLEGGENYYAPLQLLGDFYEDKVTKRLGDVEPSYAPGWSYAKLSKVLPSYVVDTLKEGILVFDRRIKGFGRNDAVLTGIETRTSAPLRLIRKENLQSLSVEGLYPAGEGAGYAGGIISAAVDGLKCAEAIMSLYSPK